MHLIIRSLTIFQITSMVVVMLFLLLKKYILYYKKMEEEWPTVEKNSSMSLSPATQVEEEWPNKDGWDR